MRASSCLLLFTASAWSAGGTTTNAAPAPPPKSAEALIENFAETLTDAPAYACGLAIKIKVKAQGINSTMDADYDVRIQKPNRWAIVMNSGMMGGTSVSDGKNVTTYSPMVKKYTVVPLPDDGELPAVGPAEAMLIGPGAFARAFFGDGLKDLLLDGVNKATLVGSDKIDGDACWHAQFEEEGITWEMWATQSEPTLLRRVTFTPNLGAAAKANDAAAGMSMEVHIDFKNWDLKPDFSDDDFDFTPPKDAEKSDTLFAGLGGRDEAPHPLLGEPAPEFEVDRLDGDAFKLADVLEKKVVMLDFWATWCGPCVDALPQVTAAAKEFEDDVVFFAVNIGEKADDVRKFLDAKELDTPVLLDAEGAVAEKYGANAIPQTVLIGKDGRVQVVHIGGSPDMKRMLVRDLRKLLKGEDLAAETLSKYKADAEEADAEADAGIDNDASTDEEARADGEAP